MEKEKIIQDLKFIQVCKRFGIDYNKCNIYDNLIIVETSSKNLYVILDENYNIVTIDKCEKNISEFIDESYDRYCEFTDILPFGNSFEYPFEHYTIKQINDISSKTNILENIYDGTTKLKINDTVYENNNPYIKLLYYIKFLDKMIDSYYSHTYPLQLIGFDVPDIYSYLRNVMKNINNCIDKKIEKGERPFPRDILIGLGENYKDRHSTNLLNEVINLLIKDKGVKIVGEPSNKVEKNNETTDDLSLLADQISHEFNNKYTEIELNKRQKCITYQNKRTI